MSGWHRRDQLGEPFDGGSSLWGQSGGTIRDARQNNCVPQSFLDTEHMDVLGSDQLQMPAKFSSYKSGKAFETVPRSLRVSNLNPQLFKACYEQVQSQNHTPANDHKCTCSTAAETNATSCSTRPVHGENDMVKLYISESINRGDDKGTGRTDRRFKCECGLSFAWGKDLQRHRRVKHNTKKIHNCGLCSRTSAWPGDQNRQFRCHVGASRPLVSGQEITWNFRIHARNKIRAQAKFIAGREEEYDAIVNQALSKEPKALDAQGTLRHYRYLQNPKAFDTQGQLRDRYFHLRNRIIGGKTARRNNKEGSLKVLQRPGRLLRPRLNPKRAGLIPRPHIDPFRECVKAHQRLRPSGIPFLEVTENWQCDWKPPNGWDKDWPEDPMFIPLCVPTVPRCDLCDTDDTCDCITKIQRMTQPEIVDCGAKGEGLKAVARKGDEDMKQRKAPVYRQGATIGLLVGQCTNDSPDVKDWSIVIYRHDLDLNVHKNRGVAVLFCRFTSNRWGKVNHTCEKPSVEIHEMTVSAKRRVVVMAKRDIFAGDILEADYGPEFWKHRKCLCGSKICYSLK